MLTRREFLSATAGVAIVESGLVTVSRGDVQPFGAAAVISGTARERGRQYGKRFESGIRHFLEHEIYGAFIAKPFVKDDMLRYAGECFKVIGKECPVIAAEMEGMAEATGLRLEEHVLITLHEELFHRGVLPPVPHCTAVAVGPPETRGETLVGQTWESKNAGACFNFSAGPFPTVPSESVTGVR